VCYSLDLSSCVAAKQSCWQWYKFHFNIMTGVTVRPLHCYFQLQYKQATPQLLLWDHSSATHYRGGWVNELFLVDNIKWTVLTYICRGLEIRVRGHLRPLKMTPVDTAQLDELVFYCEIMQETRNLKTGLMLTLALEDGCCHTFKGKRFPVKRYVFVCKCTLCLKKMHQLWNGIVQNYRDRFLWFLAEIFKSL